MAELDMAAFEISEVPHNQTVLRFRRPLALMPSLDEESQQWIILDEPELNIHVAAQTREALMEELQNHISMLWDECAVDAKSNLSPVALALRARLRAAIQEPVPALPDENRDVPGDGGISDGAVLRESFSHQGACGQEAPIDGNAFRGMRLRRVPHGNLQAPVVVYIGGLIPDGRGTS